MFGGRNVFIEYFVWAYAWVVTIVGVSSMFGWNDKFAPLSIVGIPFRDPQLTLGIFIIIMFLFFRGNAIPKYCMKLVRGPKS